MDTAAAHAKGTAPFCNKIAASIDVHVPACMAVAHRRTRDAMVIDRVVQTERIMLRQTVLFVSAPHKKAKKTKHPKLTTNKDISTIMGNLPSRETSPGRRLRGGMLSIEEKVTRRAFLYLRMDSWFVSRTTC
jgi:hypothetical protein